MVGIKKAVELNIGQYHDIQKTRIQQLNDSDICVEADYVLYWMQQSQRMEYNHALEYAVQQANDLGMGVVVVFELIPYFVISIQYLDFKIV